LDRLLGNIDNASHHKKVLNFHRAHGSPGRIIHFKLLTMVSQLSRPWGWHLLDYSQLYSAAGNLDIVLYNAKTLGALLVLFFFMAVVVKIEYCYCQKIYYSLPIYHTFGLTNFQYHTLTRGLASTFKTIDHTAKPSQQQE
jgi:hypothetical protein